jgi:colicin import membrane protein
MADANSTKRKDKARATVSRAEVDSTERAAVSAEQDAKRAKQALKQAKKESKKAQKAARKARKVADAAGKAFKKAAARDKKAKKATGRRSHGRNGDKKAKKGAGPAATASGKSASPKAERPNANAAGKSAPAQKRTGKKTARNAVRRIDRRAPHASVVALPEAVDEPDTFVLGETDRPAVD